MKIRIVDDIEQARRVQKAVNDNDGYCPCKLKKNSDTKCVCKQFRQAKPGETCKCGLYVMVENDDN